MKIPTAAAADLRGAVEGCATRRSGWGVTPRARAVLVAATWVAGGCAPTERPSPSRVVQHASPRPSRRTAAQEPPPAVNLAPIQYELILDQPQTQTLTVRMRVGGANAGALDVALPVWRPGRYQVLDLAGGVRRFAAFASDGAALNWSKTDKSTCRVRSLRELA